MLSSSLTGSVESGEELCTQYLPAVHHDRLEEAALLVVETVDF